MDPKNSAKYLIVSVVQPLVVGLPEVNDVNVGLVDGLDVALLRVDAHGNSAVDASHGHTISRLNTVNLQRKYEKDCS
jgi:hypothetical protein